MLVKTRTNGTESVLALCLVLLLFGSACTSTSIQGGESRFDAASVSLPNEDAGELDASASTWAELHRDFFGPTGQASCAGDGACHGAPSQPGAMASGYVCPEGRDACYAGITNPAAHLVKLSSSGLASDTDLHRILRKSDGTGIMPKRPEFVFSREDMARIDAWILRGAPNDAPADASTDAALDGSGEGGQDRDGSLDGGDD